MTYYRRPGFLRPLPLLLTTTRYFVGRPNDAAAPAAADASDASLNKREVRHEGRIGAKAHGGSVKPACSYHTVPLGAWSAQFRCPLCGAPREEIIGRFTDTGLEML